MQARQFYRILYIRSLKSVNISGEMPQRERWVGKKMSESDIRARLEGLVDRWIKATPSEKVTLIQEKIRLEELLDKVRSAKAV